MKILTGLGVAAPLGGLVRALGPQARLRRRADHAGAYGDIDRKLALAGECTARGMHAEAIRLYESSLEGAAAADSTIVFRLASAAVDGEDWSKAAAATERLRAEAPKTRPLEVRLLQARVLEGRGHDEEAIALYRELVPVFMGLEARYRLGALLMRLGRRGAATEVLDGVLQRATRFASPIREEQRWVCAARQALRAA